MVIRLMNKMDKKGISIVFAVFTLLVLSVLAVTIFSMISSDINASATSLRAAKAFYIAEAGIEILARFIANDIETTFSPNGEPNTTDPNANGYYSVAYLEGGYNGSYSGVNVTNPERVCIHGTSWDNPTRHPAVVQGVANASLAIWDFQQRYNLIGSRLIRTRIVCVARKVAQPDPPAEFVMQYSTDGGATWRPGGPNYSGFWFRVISDQWPTERGVYFESPNVPVTWKNMMDNSGSDFRIRVLRVDSHETNIEIDWLALMVNTEVDALTEPWADPGGQISLPAVLGDGTINALATLGGSGIEEGININNAPHMIMKELFEDPSISDGEASNLATEVINYRNSVKLFNKIEEIKQIEGGVDPNIFDGRVLGNMTVFSWRNVDLPYYTDGVSPVNVNLASSDVLKKIIECGGIDEGMAQTAGDLIVSQRQTDPFTSMYSSYQIQEIAGSRDEKSLAGFLRANLAWSDDSFRILMDVLDGSAYNVSLTENWTDPPITDAVPVCFSTHAFGLVSQGGVGDMTRQIIRTYGIVYDGVNYNWGPCTYRLPVDHTDTDPKGYWREER